MGQNIFTIWPRCVEHGWQKLPDFYIFPFSGKKERRWGCAFELLQSTGRKIYYDTIGQAEILFFCFTICGLIRVNMERLSNYLEDYFCNIDYVKQCTIKGKKLFWLGKVIFGSAGTSFLFGIVLNLSKSWIIFMSTLVTTGDKGRCLLKDFS